MSKESNTHQEYQVQGNHCGGCKKKIEAYLSAIEGIEAVEMDLTTKKVSVSGAVDPLTVLNTLHEIGFDAFLTVQK